MLPSNYWASDVSSLTPFMSEKSVTAIKVPKITVAMSTTKVESRNSVLLGQDAFFSSTIVSL